MKKPVFVEPNLDVLQIKWKSGWEDYASIKTPDDMKAAIAMVDAKPQEYRIVRQRMGTTVIYRSPRYDCRLGPGYECPICGAANEIVNQCGCDPRNLPTRVPKEE